MLTGTTEQRRMFAKRFGKNLQIAREQRGLSQEELGFLAGLHRTAVGQLERGERVARTDTLVKLCGTLEADPNQLLEGLQWTPAYYRLGGLTIADLD